MENRQKFRKCIALVGTHNSDLDIDNAFNQMNLKGLVGGIKKNISEVYIIR